MHKNLRFRCCIVAFVVMLTACGGENSDAKKESPFDAQTDALKKAKQVEQVIQEGGNKTREELERQEP